MPEDKMHRPTRNVPQESDRTFNKRGGQVEPHVSVPPPLPPDPAPDQAASEKKE